MAWLNATPKPPEGSKRAKTDANIKRVSRLAQFKRDQIAPPMPPNPAPHLIARVTEIGLTQPAGMGVGPVTWTEINEWQRATGIALHAWEARLIRRLSIEYIAEGHRAEVETCPPPWHAGVSQQEIETEQDRLRSALG